MIRVYAATLDRFGPPVLLTFVVLTVLGLAFSIWRFRHARKEGLSAGQTPESRPAEGNAA
jgi:hypothetical protein